MHLFKVNWSYVVIHNVTQYYFVNLHNMRLVCIIHSIVEINMFMGLEWELQINAC